jgi:hypothetical protein
MTETGANMTPIEVTTWPEEATRTPNSGCAWIAEAVVDGRAYTARSRHGASNELARRLVAAGLADRPMVVRVNSGRPGTTAYRSFHKAAEWTYSEGAATTLRRVKHHEMPDGVFPMEASGQNRVSLMEDEE